MRDRAVLAAALDPIITIDAHGTIQSASESAHRVLGWTPGELIGRNVNVLMPEPHHSAHDGYLARYHQTGKTNILNRARRFDAVRKDGSLIPIELCVSRADIPGQDSPLFVGLIRDMSTYAAAERSREEERVHAHELLAEQTAALQTAHLRLRMADRMASIGTLAAGLGHDMNNVLLPVRARLNALNAAVRAGKIPSAEGAHVEEIRKSVAYLQQLADGLHFLALDPESDADARGGGGSTDLAVWWSQAGALISKAVPKHVRVLASFPADLPPASISTHGLTQAVLNLVVNAGEAIPSPTERKRRQGMVRVWADTGEGPDGARVRLGVSDNGTGMPEEVKRRAFEMFFTTKTRGLGTGLGLALVRKVVERAGGTVEIDSQVGKGTNVIMILPAATSGRGQADAAKIQVAAVLIGDGRATALIGHILESSGTPLRADNDFLAADIWILDPAVASVARAKSWHQRRPHARVVLFGRPDPASVGAWSALNPLIINDRNDFDAVRAALGDAISG